MRGRRAAPSVAGMLKRRLLLLPSLLAAVAAVVSLAPPSAAVAAAAKTTPAAARRSAPDQAASARALAARIVGARSDGARRAALLKALRALRVGVYTGGGRALVRGTERSARDVFLYDAEVRALVTALKLGTTLDRAQLGERLVALRLLRRPLTAAQLARGISAARRASRDPAALGGLLIDELGLQGRRAPGTFDALQTWLIEAELVARASARRRAAASGAGRAPSAASPRIAAAADGSGCFTGAGAVADVLTGLGILGGAFGVTPADNAAVALWHASTLRNLIQVDWAQTGGVTHDGPAGHAADAGRDMTFVITVRAPVGASEREIRCGALRGAFLPREGALQNVPIDWETLAPDALATLRRHGTITRMDAKTGSAGSALLVFVPASEAIPGVGEIRSVGGEVAAQPQLGAAFGNLAMRELAQFRGPLASFRFSIGFHRARGYRFVARTDVLCFSFEGCTPHSYRNTFTYTGEMCGPDPYAATWRGVRTKWQETEGEEPEVTMHDYEFTLTRGGTARTFPPSREGRMDDRVEFTLLELAPALLRVDAYYSNLAGTADLYRTYEAHKTGVLEENLNCPAAP